VKKNLAIISILVLRLSLCAQEINHEKLASLLEQAEDLNSEAVIIYQGDSLITENYFGVGNPDTLIETMSCTKSIVGLAVICMLDDGLIDSLQTPVHIYYPEWNVGPKKKITIEHLLTMTSGLQNYPRTDVEIYPSPDFVQLALIADLTENPGVKFRYNNKHQERLSGTYRSVLRVHSRTNIQHQFIFRIQKTFKQ